MEQLPDYMKLCFLALYNTTNDIAYEALKEEGLNVIPYLKKAVVFHFLCLSFIILVKLSHIVLLGTQILD